ncbi:MAG: hypothetical protein Fues2KO_40500 [Fuerstiella sp.]
MKYAGLLFFPILLVSGCSEAPTPDATVRPAENVIRECVKNSGPKLDAALKDGDVATAAREIVQVLDDYEDSPAMAPYEEFHRQMEQLEGLTAREPASDAVAEKIDEIKTLAAELVANSDA